MLPRLLNSAPASRPAILAAAAASVVLALASSGEAQLRRVDGCALRTLVVPLSGPTGTSADERCGAVPVVEDGWTVDSECIVTSDPPQLEMETYTFPQVGPILRTIFFVEKVKLPPLPPDAPATSYTVVEDVFVLPCSARTGANPTGEDFEPSHLPPLLFIDDVTFAGIEVDPRSGPREFLLAFALPVDELSSLGIAGSVDWFAIADLDAAGGFYGQEPTRDRDGNGCPDSCVEISGGSRFVPHKGIDENGAALVDFVLNRRELGLTRVDVFEPRTSSMVPPVLPGMQGGESHDTRPWCFQYLIGD